MLQANPYIDKIHLYDESLPDVIRNLKPENFDYVVDLHNNFRSIRVRLGIGVKSYAFNKLNIRKLVLTKLKINILPDAHIVERNLATVKAFGVTNDGKGLDYFIPEEDEFPLSELPDSFQNGYVALVLAGTYFTKRLPAEKYRKLITETKMSFVLLGGKSERTAGATIMSWNTGNVIDFTGKLRLNQSASLVKNAQLVVANDTGLMHIAAAFHKKILSVWGNTVPEFGMYPYLPGDGSEILEVDGLKCRPCSKLGYRQCPKKHFRCMNEIPEQRIADWVNNEF